MAETKINTGIQFKGETFLPNRTGDVERLAKVATQDELDAFRKRRVDPENEDSPTLIQGAWKSSRQAAAAPPSAAATPPAGNTAGATELPPGFPGRQFLIKAGYDTPQKVRDAADSDLAAIDGVGEATVAKIREAQK